MRNITEYLASLKEKLGGGIATEHTYRFALQRLLEASEEGIAATNEPKRTVCGAPDFNITHKKVLLGYVETKDIGTNLDEMELGKGPHGGQFIRYRDGLPNWILTDYLEFRWFVNGKKRLTARIAELDAKGKIRPTQDGEQNLAQLLHAFFKEPALTVATAKDLATSMAHMTRIVRDQIIDSLKKEDEETERRRVKEETTGYGSAPSARGPWLREWLSAFREVLIPDLDEPQFADMFAQTLAYGLFAARVHAPSGKDFSREMAAFNLPKTNPFLRKLFQEIAGDIPDSISWAVDDIVELLKHADMSEILKDFGKGKGKEDPVVHFYETFLAAYDPKMRELRGVYYTPEPVVSYIVRSIDHLLKTRFNRPKGLADENTLILDPATGTATFLYFVIDQIHQTFAKQAGAWDDYVAQHLLNRIFGFELLMAPYAVAHLKLGMQLEQTGYKFGSDQRLGIYLTNTLEEAAKKSEQLFAGWVAEEANAASRIKRDEPILVVLGNPPYSNYGRMNRGKWILSLLDDYKRDLHEKKLNIDDDFIKFIRFAQWRVEKTGHGIIGLITNNVYLDGITHRRIRECLLNTFNEIYILNLHGNIRKKETAPDGSADKNVFDIQQGVAIGLFVKIPNKSGCRLFHADLWGKREAKYEALWEQDAGKISWMELSTASPYFFFIPINLDAESEYTSGSNVASAFTEQNTGIQTKRDELFIEFDKETLARRFDDIAAHSNDTSYLKEKYGLEDSSGWKVSKLAGLDYQQDAILQVFYRPFDIRWIYYDPAVLGRARESTMHHMIAGKNLGLITLRINEGGDQFVCLVARHLIEKGSLPRGNYSLFPLYLYPTAQYAQGKLLPEPSRCPNLSPTFLKALAEKLRLSQTEPFGLPKGTTPEDIFNYAYAVFHSPTYRKRYAEFLKIDFPRLPLTSSLKLFRALAAKGAELVALHLLESPKVYDFITEFSEKGDNVVEKVQFVPSPALSPRKRGKDREQGRVFINKIQYFGGVPEAVWKFHIGGYQVCEKWLKDRKGRILSYDDIQHYQKIVVALNETIRLMAEIDKLIPSWPIS
jgi:predicted helicase